MIFSAGFASYAKTQPPEACFFMSEITVPTVESAIASLSEPTIEEPETPTTPIGDPDDEASPSHQPIEEPEDEPEENPNHEHEPIKEPEPDPEDEPIRDPNPEPLPGEDSLAASTLKTAAPVAVPKPLPPAAVLAPEPEEPEESFSDLFAEFNRTSSRRDSSGGSSQIRGTVVAVTDDSVLVDIGYKSEGILPVTAFPANRETGLPTIKAGDQLQVSVKGRDTDGYYELSLFKTAQPKDWSSLEKAFQERSTIVGTVTAVVKGGLHVDVGIKAFLPASRSGARDAAEMEKLVGEEIRVRITKLDVADEDLVVDRRVVTEEETLESKGRRFAEVEEGAVVSGTVRSLTDYGAFVDLGGIDGLLHISDISWNRVTNVADLLTVGQQLEVKVLKIDPETRRIALGLKQLQAHPWAAAAERYHLGDRVKGVVSRIADFGAFIELEPGVDGLVHLSEMSYTKRVLKATEVVQLGDVVDAVILAISIPERRISLGLKQALGDPWVDAAGSLTPGSIVEGPVASLTKFGAFITVAEGIQGLVHISEIVTDRRLNHPSDVLHTGQIVKALVLDADKEKRQLKLSIKQLIPTGLDEFLAEHKVGDSVTGRVVSAENGNAQIELGEGIFVSCALPKIAPVQEAAAAAQTSAKVDLSAFSSMLKNKWKTGSASTDSPAKSKSAQGEITAGQVRSFRITAIDPAAKQVAIELAQ